MIIALMHLSVEIVSSGPSQESRKFIFLLSAFNHLWSVSRLQDLSTDSLSLDELQRQPMRPGHVLPFRSCVGGLRSEVSSSVTYPSPTRPLRVLNSLPVPALLVFLQNLPVFSPSFLHNRSFSFHLARITTWFAHQ